MFWSSFEWPLKTGLTVPCRPAHEILVLIASASIDNSDEHGIHVARQSLYCLKTQSMEKEGLDSYLTRKLSHACMLEERL